MRVLVCGDRAGTNSEVIRERPAKLIQREESIV
jgi:hypothetical protein